MKSTYSRDNFLSNRLEPVYDFFLLVGQISFAIGSIIITSFDFFFKSCEVIIIDPIEK